MSADDLAGKSKRNAVGFLVAFLVNALATLLASPVLAGALGEVAFGSFKVVQRFVDLAGAVDGRPSQALKWVLANLQGVGTDHERQQAIGSSLRTLRRFFPLLLLSACAVPLLAPASIAGLDAQARLSVTIAAAIFGVSIVLSPLLAIPDAVLMGMHKGYLSLLPQSIWILLCNIAMVICALGGADIVGVASVYVASAIASAATVLIVAKKQAPWLSPRRPDVDKDRKFFAFSRSLLGWAVIEKVMLAQEMILLSVLVGAAAVSDYVFSSYVFQTGLAICLFAGASIAPGIGSLIGAGKKAVAAEIASSTREVVLFVAVLIAAGAILINEVFVSLWAGRDRYVGNLVNAALAVSFIQLALIRVDAQIQDLRLDVGKRIGYSVASLTLSIVLGLVGYLATEQSIAGMLFGVIAGRIVMARYFEISIRNWLGITRSRSARVALIALCILTTSILASNWLSEVREVTVKLILILPLIGVLVAIAYIGMLSTRTRQSLKSSLTQKVMRGGGGR